MPVGRSAFPFDGRSSAPSAHEPRLHVAFLWHMHQPSYRDPVTGEVLLPWVRLHGVKDYTDMAAALDEVPGARTTVNWVPGLLDQCEALASPDYGQRERFWRLTERPAADLSAVEIETLRQHFFSLSHANMLEPYPRYRELRDRVRQAQALTTSELRDLQVWFNLAWTGVTVRREPEVARLFAKGRDFEEADKRPLLEVQRKAVLGLVSRWRALSERGQVELSASPQYHPILPLLIDSDLARAADPSTPLPSLRFRWKGDAELQIRRATLSHAERFGAPPRGMWPSEGSVTAELLPLIRESGLDWIVTDEAILWKTQAGAAMRGAGADKFRPWTLDGVTLFFRDHGLSDKIGFVYATWPRERAYADFVGSLREIRKVALAQSPGQDAVVTIALDGENCWEHYPGGITAFLPGLLRAIEATPGLQLSTLSEARAAVPASPLPGLGTGSWIDGTFRTWLGDPVKNKAWELLTAARQAVRRPIAEVMREEPGLADLVLRAEASDWWWWFGEGHSSSFDAEFDALFRAHLMAIWVALGKAAPDNLQKPVHVLAGPGAVGPQTQRHKRPMTQIEPELDGSRGWYFKWLGAGEILQSFGAIHRAESLFSRILYGNDDRAVFLRVDARERCDRALAALGDGLQSGAAARVELTVQGADRPRTLTLWPPDPAMGIEAALGEVLEIRIPLESLAIGALPVRLRGHLDLMAPGGDVVLERFPGNGDLELELVSALDAALNIGV
ncbi:MAG: glycoside hydrolase [Deltaproteobacteria bacterium]|nr:glycoside hydrolase [Deltaproteobacteria bacterium]